MRTSAKAAPPEDEYPWFRDGSVPQSREDRIAEVLALIALLFSLGIGLVIAMLPVSAKADTVVMTIDGSASQPAAGDER